MKKWNTPAITEINVSETANGFWPGNKECGWFIFGTHATHCNGHHTEEDATKDENKDVVDANS